MNTIPSHLSVFNIDTAKSYATEDNLVSALKKCHLFGIDHMVVRNRAGRYTAIFMYSRCQDVNPGSIAHLGFKIVS